MLATLRALLIALGASAMLIAFMDIHLGAQSTAAIFEGLYGAATGWRGHAEPWPPTMDSELRFYAAMWGAYGVALIWTARELPARLGLVPWQAGVFFVGGFGRALSQLTVGPPHPFFTLLMWTELALPPVLIALWLGARRRAPL